MKTVKLSVFAIGVALSVAPIFNSAVAQDRTGQASVMIELQTLRSEIAELRDLVERQQFEMQKLKRSLVRQNPVSPQSAYGAPAQQYGTQPQYQTAPASTAVGAEPSIQTDRPASGSPSFSDGYQAQNSQNQAYQESVAPANDYANAANQPSYQDDSQPSTPDYNYPSQNSGPEVIEREITAAPIDDQYSSQESGPEIVERGISSDGRITQAPVLSQKQQGEAVSPRFTQNSFPEDGSPSVAIEQTEVRASTYQQSSPAGVGIEAAPTSPVGRPILSVPVTNADVVSGQQAPVNQRFNDSSSEQRPLTQASPVVASPAQFSEDDFYDRGFGLLKESKYDEAVNVFKEQIVQHPTGSLADDAHYWIAEAMFINRKPAEARPHLKAIINDFPQSARVPDAMLKSAYIEQEIGNLIEARILFQEIVSRHPSSNAAIAAKNRLTNLQVRP